MICIGTAQNMQHRPIRKGRISGSSLLPEMADKSVTKECLLQVKLNPTLMVKTVSGRRNVTFMSINEETLSLSHMPLFTCCHEQFLNSRHELQLIFNFRALRKHLIKPLLLYLYRMSCNLLSISS